MDTLWNSAEKAAVESMVKIMVWGGPEKVRKGLQDLVNLTQADELILTSDLFDPIHRLRSYEIVAEVYKNQLSK
jgi:alkanesulfonate monooxygenase SsuD/methylene tetrahydromethanopterin reductase-like flavin-dependent oxidoreductase (luciferase family)